VHNLGKGVL
jgi:hypothetical protein